MLTLDGITLRIAGRPLIEAASVALPPGQRTGLVGRNGAGKSTLLAAISGALSPDAGTIRMPPRARMGMLRQEAPGGAEEVRAHVLAGDEERTAILAALEAGEPLGSQRPVHPNDHVNCSQSTNDAFPAAIHIAAARGINHRLLPELDRLVGAFSTKAELWQEIVKIGRTHLQDAVPLTLGQETSAWRDQVAMARGRIASSLQEVFPLPLGGTAVGTGLNAPDGFALGTADELARLTGLPFSSAPNKFAVMASHDGLVNAMGQLRLLAVSLLKIANDIRLLACANFN